MKIYAKINDQEQTIDETSHPVCPHGYVEMKGQRPVGDYWVASKNGAWVESLDLAKQTLLSQAQANHQEAIESGLTIKQQHVPFSSRSALHTALADAKYLGKNKINLQTPTGWIELSLSHAKEVLDALIQRIKALDEIRQTHEDAIQALPSIAEAKKYTPTF